MKNRGTLDSANAAEAEMAAVAHQCLVTALDHSNADHINIILDVGTDGAEKHETPVLKLPPRAMRFLPTCCDKWPNKSPCCWCRKSTNLRRKKRPAF